MKHSKETKKEKKEKKAEIKNREKKQNENDFSSPDKKTAGEKQIKRIKASSAAVGIIISVFAVVGIIFLINYGVDYYKENSAKAKEIEKFNQYLTPAAAVDLDEFDDITDADSSSLIDAAIWSILSKSTTPDTYSYTSDGYMKIPLNDVKSALDSMFGPEAVNSVEYQNVTGNDYVFIYDSSASEYKIPVTSLTPIYTPDVTDVSKSGDIITVTCGYISYASWDSDSNGNITKPDPDRIVKFTLRQLSGNYYISSVRMIKNTSPETVSVQVDEKSEANSDSETSSELTTTSEENSSKS